MSSKRLFIDGSHGEGGGQILRTAVALSAITGRPIRIGDIRAGRPRPGLAAQHVTSVRAAAALCGARLAGDELGSTSLDFVPTGPARAGAYAFDVAAARKGGSAGAAALVLQTVLLPLALADGDSRVTVQGGTHLSWSPPFDYLRDVWLPALARMGISAAVELAAWGWYPIGRGEIRATVSGLGASGRAGLRPLTLVERPPLRAVTGRAVAARLPEHIVRRMAERAGGLLEGAGIPARISPEVVAAACPGAGIFLVADYGGLFAGFCALGRRGKPAEEVAEEAVAALLVHRDSGGALDRHLADQMVLPLALAAGPSRVSVERITRHLETNAWVVGRFGLAEVTFERQEEGAGLVSVRPNG